MGVEVYFNNVLQDLEKNYLFVTKQTLKDSYFPFFIGKVCESYLKNPKGKKFNVFYSDYFNNDPFMRVEYPKQTQSFNTYRNAIIAEFIGFIERSDSTYASARLTGAFNCIRQYINNYDDYETFKILIDKQIEKLCLNINPSVDIYCDVYENTTFITMLLYKILLKLYDYDKSGLTYDEFLVFLNRAKHYNDNEDILRYIIEYRNSKDSSIINKFEKIREHSSSKNVRYAQLLTTLNSIQYKNNIFEIKDNESYLYMDYIVQLFEKSEYKDLKDKKKLKIFLMSENYFIGKLNAGIITKINITKQDIATNKKENISMVNRTPRINKNNRMNVILSGAPGTGKTYSTTEWALAMVEGRTVRNVDALYDMSSALNRLQILKKSGQVKFATFHQSYSYEDFIQGLRPVVINGNISFEYKDGVFVELAKKAMNDTQNAYVLIIDEINRGNISQVFGELITLIEEDKRWGEKNQMSVILPSGEEFAVPNNLYILGTMNTADKSISIIDSALRRRFSFNQIDPNPELVFDSTLKDFLIRLNHTLKIELKSADLLIGHAYFIGKSINNLVEIINDNIMPLLYEYFYDDEIKIRKTLEYALNGKSCDIVDNSQGRLRAKWKS